eukprot:229875-Prymnesium_polylepis.1
MREGGLCGGDVVQMNWWEAEQDTICVDHDLYVLSYANRARRFGRTLEDEVQDMPSVPTVGPEDTHLVCVPKATSGLSPALAYHDLLARDVLRCGPHQISGMRPHLENAVVSHVVERAVHRPPPHLVQRRVRPPLEVARGFFQQLRCRANTEVASAANGQHPT